MVCFVFKMAPFVYVIGPESYFGERNNENGSTVDCFSGTPLSSGGIKLRGCTKAGNGM